MPPWQSPYLPRSVLLWAAPRCHGHSLGSVYSCPATGVVRAFQRADGDVLVRLHVSCIHVMLVQQS